MNQSTKTGDHFYRLQLYPRTQRYDYKSGPVRQYGFAGIGSVPWQALKLGRRGVGIELKRSYYLVAARYLDDLEMQLAQPAMFDMDALAAGKEAA